MAPQDFQTLHEIVQKARLNLDQNLWDYLVGGAETETTLKRNRLALDSLALKHRVLNDVSRVDVSGSLLGHPLRIPVLLCPIGSLQAFEAGGGASAAKAATEFGTINILSSACLPGLEEVAAASSGAKIYQQYLVGDDQWLEGMVQRAIDHGYKAFCLVTDTAVYSRRERDMAKRYITPSRKRRAEWADDFEPDMKYQATMTWNTVKRIKDRFEIPLILKGIGTAEDAALACEHGVEVVYVSNHGGRQGDQGRGTMEILPEVMEAVQGQAQIVIDGGFLRGTDVIKAIALGADAVGVGRLQGFAMAAGGVAAVVRALEILEHEIQANLALMGLDSMSKLDASWVCKAPPVTPPHVTSAFPLLDI